MASVEVAFVGSLCLGGDEQCQDLGRTKASA